ncbi:hypothetical protein K4B79_36190 [Streptomyces lincolnensis]|uniref:hypothetical protein n=1 Tax=Streptomyces lincolnensis TaxID=1915 RepID=UPI001E5D2005|nr:hypothetical protein [Streptomyces lincolnensis]MCD7443635.1 hypothetical protein [Streptomyces lincolnensis]
MTTNVSFDGDWRATVTDEPLPVTPRFTGDSVDIAPYADREERERFLAATFGSDEWLWDTPDTLRFDPDSRKLVGAELRLPYVSANAETTFRVPALPPVRQGGLRADEVRDFRHEMCAVLCRAPEDAELACLRDLDVLDAPLDARIGIAPDLALLVQHGTVVGWSLTDPARHLTTPFTEPSPTPPSPATRRLLTECLNLVTQPLFDALEDDDPTALARLHATAQALRTQPTDRPRADTLLTLIANLLEDHPDGTTGRNP